MKLVTFAVPTPIGRTVRLGALVDGHQDGRIVDLTAAYGAYLAAETDEPTPRELAALRTPPDIIGWLRGAHKARDKDPAFERCIEDDLAAAGLLGRIGLPRWRSRLCWAFSDHDHGLPMRLSGHGKGTSQVFGGSLMTVLQSNLSDDQ